MDMQNFYDTYQLNKTVFSEMVHVGLKTINKYAKGEPIRESSRRRIERGISLVEKHNLICPDGYRQNFSHWHSFEYDKFRNYKKEFEKLFDIEE